MPDIFVSSSVPPRPPFSLEKKNKKTSRINQALSACLFMPEGIRFETQDAHETIFLLLRKHWITNIVWVMISILLLVSPLFIFPAVILSGNLPQQLSGNLLTVLILSWYLLTFSYILVNFLLWYFTVSIITDERVVDIDFINILNKKFAETRITRIEDVTMRTGGFIKTFFDYGDVYVQTAAKDAVFQFEAVPKPDQVVRVINHLMGKEEEEGELHV